MNDLEAIAKEEVTYKSVPFINYVSPEDVEENYKQIKREVAGLVKSEMDKIEAQKAKEENKIGQKDVEVTGPRRKWVPCNMEPPFSDIASQENDVKVQESLKNQNEQVYVIDTPGCERVINTILFMTNLSATSIGLAPLKSNIWYLKLQYADVNFDF